MVLFTKIVYENNFFYSFDNFVGHKNPILLTKGFFRREMLGSGGESIPQILLLRAQGVLREKNPIYLL